MTLNEILTKVADGSLSVAEAERLIRQGPPRPPKNAPVVIGLIFAGLGLLAVVIALVAGANSWLLVMDAKETEGTVIRLVPTGERRGGLAPLFRYQAEGQVFEVQSSVSSSPPAYAVGEKVKILYYPDRPADGRPHEFMELWFFPILVGGFGSVFLLVGLMVIMTRARVNRPLPGKAPGS
jgi:hypothetical protein